MKRCTRGLVGDRTHGIRRRQADIALHDVGAGSRQISNIDAGSPRTAHGHLNGRIAQHTVSEHDVSFDSSNEHDAVGVAEDDVVDNDVVVGTRRNKADAEVTTLSCVTISS